jgi:3-oxoacyl-[acyl-carrier protein] reductase
MGIRHVAPYAESKRGVLGVTSTLAVEWTNEGICVDCLAPGYIETDLTKARFDDPVFTAAFHNACRWAGAVIQPTSLEPRVF